MSFFFFFFFFLMIRRPPRSTQPTTLFPYTTLFRSLSELLTLDMGGTSADASLVTGGAPVSDGGTGGGVAGIPLALPAVLIETVSAGGGSIARVDAGGALKVGPESAGAVPGPACYGRGGERPTVTDACLVLGWLDPAHPLADDVRLDAEAARRSLAAPGMTSLH